MARVKTPGKNLAPQSAWVVTGGFPGHREPCIGVAEWLGLDAGIKTVAPNALYRLLAPWGPAGHDPHIASPWPDLLLASGRQSIPYARAIRKRSRGRTFVAVLQNPVVAPAHFDLVWVPEHDSLAGPNVLRTVTTPNRVTPARLKAQADALGPRLGALAGPYVGVLLGGASATHSFTGEDAARLGEALKTFSARHGVSLLVTASRRTGAGNAAILRAKLDPARAWIWDDSGANPYLGILGLSQAIVATADSVNMLGEAAATGVPVYAYGLRGNPGKQARFHQALIDQGAMRWFDGALDHWTYTPINATESVADEILSRWRARACSAQIVSI